LVRRLLVSPETKSRESRLSRSTKHKNKTKKKQEEEGFDSKAVCDTLTAGLVCSALMQAEDGGRGAKGGKPPQADAAELSGAVSERACAVLDGVGSFLDLTVLMVESAHLDDGPVAAGPPDHIVDISQVRAAWQAVAAGLRQWAANPALRQHIAAASGQSDGGRAAELPHAAPRVWQSDWSHSPTALGLIGDEIQAVINILQACG
jgi:hypothetical protein